VSGDIKAALAAQFKGPFRASPSRRVTEMLGEAISDAPELLAAANVGSERPRTASEGALAVTTEDLVVARTEKSGARIERYAILKLRGLATWGITVAEIGDLTVMALMLEDESLVPLPLKPKDAQRVLAALPDVVHEQAVHLTTVKVLVTPSATIKPKAVVALTVTSVGIRMQLADKPLVFDYLPRSEIENVSIDGVDQIQLRPSVLATAAFGVMGLAARKKEKRAYLVVSTARGDGVYEVSNVLPTELRARLSPLLKTIESSAHAPPQTRSDPIEQIQRLAELRDQGIVTEEEFKEAKADLLGQLRH
jgi:hypothetical protein